ncbi:DUF6911 family protein [Pseudomonas huanghezhanensis]|uniref:DUF6911 family protein n=1 Tax=Pseudomonas huanghezhanensis TaxID=3002903 RepID=UPI002285B3F7|nr:hypothetical protein [Pseudomonas sp. BSw22131]
MELSWSILRDEVWSGGTQRVQGWDDVMQHLVMLHDRAGALSLHIMDGPDPGPMQVSVQAERGKYLLTLLEATEDGTDVRSYENVTAAADTVDILGDNWSARQLTDDFDLVVMMFKEFFETGYVSRKLLY